MKYRVIIYLLSAPLYLSADLGALWQNVTQNARTHDIYRQAHAWAMQPAIAQLSPAERASVQDQILPLLDRIHKINASGTLPKEKIELPAFIQHGPKPHIIYIQGEMRDIAQRKRLRGCNIPNSISSFRHNPLIVKHILKQQNPSMLPQDIANLANLVMNGRLNRNKDIRFRDDKQWLADLEMYLTHCVSLLQKSGAQPYPKPIARKNGYKCEPVTAKEFKAMATQAVNDYRRLSQEIPLVKQAIETFQIEPNDTESDLKRKNRVHLLKNHPDKAAAAQAILNLVIPASLAPYTPLLLPLAIAKKKHDDICKINTLIECTGLEEIQALNACIKKLNRFGLTLSLSDQTLNPTAHFQFLRHPHVNELTPGQVITETLASKLQRHKQLAGQYQLAIIARQAISGVPITLAQHEQLQQMAGPFENRTNAGAQLALTYEQQGKNRCFQ